MKYWISELPGNDKLIIWDGNKLYKANPKEHKLREFDYSLRNKEIPVGLFAIYKSQIRLIEMDESKKYICVYFGADSSEHFRVSNTEIKKEIFNELAKTEDVIKNVKELTLSEKLKIKKKHYLFYQFSFL